MDAHLAWRVRHICLHAALHWLSPELLTTICQNASVNEIVWTLNWYSVLCCFRVKNNLNFKRLCALFYFQVSKLLQVNQDLSARLQHYELAYEQLRCENMILQDKLHQLGINVLDIVTKPHATNGGLKLVKSPSRSPPETLSSRHRGYLGPIGQLPAHHMLEMMVKKERDTWTKPGEELF